MIIIITIIQGTGCNTEADTVLLNKRLSCGTIYMAGNSYYLYCKSILLNGNVESGMSLYESEYPSAQESKKDMVDNYVEETRKLIPELGTEEKISREITEQITLLPREEVIRILVSEILKSKIDIGNAVVLCKKYPFIEMCGCTYDIQFHDSILIPLVTDEIPEHDNYYVAVNEGDKVLRRTIDDRGYPPSCGVENKGKDVIMVVKSRVEQKPELGELRDFE